MTFLDALGVFCGWMVVVCSAILVVGLLVALLCGLSSLKDLW